MTSQINLKFNNLIVCTIYVDHDKMVIKSGNNSLYLL